MIVETDQRRQGILILDFGSQYTQLIARCVRESQVYCEILPYDAPFAEVEDFDPAGLILSGGPATVTEVSTPRAEPKLFEFGRPILGICYGMQTMAAQLGGEVENAHSFIEENSGEDGFLNDALNDKDKVTKATVTARLKLATDPDEKAALKQAKKLFDAEFEAKKTLKEAQDALDLAVFKQYPKLSIDEIKSLIVDDKWLATLESNIVAEIERVTQQLANRVKELEERYSEPLPTITQSVENLSDKVAGHLKAMGLEWAL